MYYNFIFTGVFVFIYPYPGFIFTGVFAFVYLYYGFIPTVPSYQSVLCPKIAGRRGRDRMVVEFTITYEISAYHH